MAWNSRSRCAEYVLPLRRERKVRLSPTGGVLFTIAFVLIIGGNRVASTKSTRGSLMISCNAIRSLSLIVAMGGISFSTMALSQQDPVRGPLPFSAYDQNGDGFVSKDEFNTVREKRRAEGMPMRNAASFTDLDQNQDGKLSAEEFAARRSARGNSAGAGAGAGMRVMMPKFSEFDLNKDGKITEEEFNDARTARITERLQEGYQMRGLAKAPSFAEFDTNHDAVISPEEFSAQLAMHRQQKRP